METGKFIRKPFDIEAIRVTEDNINEVAAWCDGRVLKDEGKKESPFIKVRVHHPLTQRQTKAFVGDWVLYAGKGYKVYTNTAFERSFDPVPIEAPQELLVTTEKGKAYTNVSDV